MSSIRKTVGCQFRHSDPSPRRGFVPAAIPPLLVRLDEDADSDQVEQRALARDLEGDALWLVDVRALGALAGYGDAFKVLWRSDELLVADDAAA